MDSLQRQSKYDTVTDEETTLENVGEVDEDTPNLENQPKKEKISFLDSLTNRVKDFLDKAE